MKIDNFFHVFIDTQSQDKNLGILELNVGHFPEVKFKFPVVCISIQRLTSFCMN